MAKPHLSSGEIVAARMTEAYRTTVSLLEQSSEGDLLARRGFRDFRDITGRFIMESRLHGRRLDDETVRKAGGAVIAGLFHKAQAITADWALRTLPEALTQVDEELTEMLEGQLIEVRPLPGVKIEKVIRPVETPTARAYPVPMLGAAGGFGGINSMEGQLTLENGRHGASWNVQVVDLHEGEIQPLVSLNVSPLAPVERPLLGLE